jgi:predicted transcriptional regulator
MFMGITSVRLTDDLDQPLDLLAKKLDRSKNYLINQAIKEFLAKQSLEDSRWQDTLEALDSVKAGKSLNETDVNSWLDSWGTGKRTSQPKL